MKHARLKLFLIGSVFAFPLLLATQKVMAQTSDTTSPAPAASGSPVVAGTTPETSANNSATAMTNSTGTSLSDVPAVPVMSAATGSTAEDPAISAVVDRLRQDENRVSVGDLTAAQDTVTRLDLLLEIEKRITDIDKTRTERTGMGLLAMNSPDQIAANMPKDSLNMPTGGSMTNGRSGNSGDFSVARITGRQNRFTAVLIGSDSKQITVQAGDTIPGGYKVDSISSNGVRVSSKSGSKILPLSGS